MIDKTRKATTTILQNKRLVRYFIMACIIVLIELAAFQAMYVALNDYVFATVGSFIVGVVLNWIFGRIFIFKKSTYSEFGEFALVLGASIVGVSLQLGVVALSVQVLHLYPLLGKALSIVVSFFWNYWFRAKFIYKSTLNTKG